MKAENTHHKRTLEEVVDLLPLDLPGKRDPTESGGNQFQIDALRGGEGALVPARRRAWGRDVVNFSPRLSIV
jgi:hypothetical protein